MKFQAWILRKAVPALTGAILIWASTHPIGAGEETRSLAGTVKALQALHLDKKAASSAMPEKGRKLLAELKKEVGLTIQGVVAGASTKDPDKIRDNLIKKLKNRDVLIDTEQNAKASKIDFGRVTALQVAVPAQAPDLLVIEASFSLPCGWNDTDFYLFRYVKRDWLRILVQTTAEYGDISGGQGRFDYALSTRSEAGAVLVVTALVPPNCDAEELPIRYNVYRVASGPLEAQPLFSGVTSEPSEDGTYKLQPDDTGMMLKYRISTWGGARVTLRMIPRGTHLEITRTRDLAGG